MDLQLNVKTVSKKPKMKQKDGQSPNTSKSDYSFVSKPVVDGKIIAKTRNKFSNSALKSNFSFLKHIDADAESKPNENTNKYRDKIKKAKNIDNLDNKTMESDKVSSKSQNIVKESDRRIEKKTNEMDININVDLESSDLSMNVTSIPINKQSKKKNIDKSKNTQNLDVKKPEIRKRTIQSHISSLFRNNPDIPKLGQRFVKPIAEKVFSGQNFKDLGVHDFSVANLEKNLGLKLLTVVQQKACPIILQGRDVLVRSQTGSGKTLAYALPIVEGLQAIRPKLKRQDGIKALVIVPTRELALQTYELFVKLVKSFTWIVPGLLIGGEKRKSEKVRIRKGFNILIGTPGRICDHLQHTASLTLGKTRCLVLDEADRLLDMGYEKDVSSIVDTLKRHQAADKYDPMAMIRETVKTGHIHFSDEDNEEAESSENDRKKSDRLSSQESAEITDEAVEYKHHLSNVLLSDRRQTILLSATLTKAVETLAGLTLEDPVFIDASEGRATLIADSLATKTTPAAPKMDTTQEDENSQSEDGDFEIVPQEESQENESENESDNEDSSDDDNADEGESDDNDSNTDEDSDASDDDSSEEETGTTYKGLKEFKGIKTDKKESKKNTDIENEEIIQEENINKVKSKKTDKKGIVKATDGGESDSDSDYDFFAVAKVDIKTPKDKEKMIEKETKKSKLEESEFVTEKGDCENPFQNALQNAITQDEMVIPSSVTQLYILAPMKLRLVTLSALIIERCVKPGTGKMLIFMATQDMIDYHCELLSRVLAGRKPNVVIEDEKDTSSNSKRFKRLAKRQKELEEMMDDDEEKLDSEEVTKTEAKVDDTNEDYEFNFDDMMDLSEYEAKMQEKKAFVNVEFFQLHGSMSQKTRTHVFNTFRKATSGVLLCTTRPITAEFIKKSQKQKNKPAQYTKLEKLQRKREKIVRKLQMNDHSNKYLLKTRNTLNRKINRIKRGQLKVQELTLKNCNTVKNIKYVDTNKASTSKFDDACTKFKMKYDIMDTKNNPANCESEDIARNMTKYAYMMSETNILKNCVNCIDSRNKNVSLNCESDDGYVKYETKSKYGCDNCRKFKTYDKLFISKSNDGDKETTLETGNDTTKICNLEGDVSVSSGCVKCSESDGISRSESDRNIVFFKLNENSCKQDILNVLKKFDQSSNGVLLCTDVAARGLDLPHVDCIVQYTGPISVTDYVHRVGRTARAGNVGMAVMILLPSEVEFVRQLELRRIRLYQEDMEICHQSLIRENADTRRQIKSGGPPPVHTAAAELQQHFEELVKSDKELYMKACKAFTSWLRFYSTYPREARVAFDRRAIHMGHACTSLALSDTPKKIGKEAPKPVNRKDSDLKRRAEREKNTRGANFKPPSVKAAKREKQMLLSEFESGLEPAKKKKKAS